MVLGLQGEPMAVFAVTTAKGSSWDVGRPIREQQAWDEHGAFADRLVEQGVIILGGPISSDSEDEGFYRDGQPLRW
jgi:hypothetical protein